MNRLAEILLNKSLDACSEEELLSIAQRYPFFNAGHLLAVQKLQKTHSTRLPESIQKASLHFKSLYINQVISEKGNAEIIPAIAAKPQEQLQTEIPKEPSPEETLSKDVHTDPQNEISEIPVADLPTEDLVPREEHQMDSRAVQETDEQTTLTTQDESEPVENQILNSPVTQDSEFDNVQSSHNDELIVSKEQPVPISIDQDSGSDIDQVEEPKKEQPAGSGELSFEPYHTVDYFASQGIKVKLEDNATDKFSKQLRSFTEWLKTLKKLPDNETIPPANPAIEKKVDLLAESSLTDSNVITEAMAEVWIKQGNPQKAIDIYQKLSLLEPAKSTYFASLIEDLKKASL